MELGYIKRRIIVKEDATPIDNVTKFAYADDDYEIVEEFVPYTEEELRLQAGAESSQEYDKQFKQAVQMYVNSQITVLSDDKLLEMNLLFDEWTVGYQYKEDDVVRYAGELWQALQDSTGEEQYPPDQFTAGWKRIGEPDERGVFPWSQPLGATDAYPLGATVAHNGKTWENTIENNVWEPGVYGWKEVGSGEAEEWPEWVQPTGAHDAYSQGAKVSHNGKHWTSDVDGNVWEPGVYGWTEEQ